MKKFNVLILLVLGLLGLSACTNQQKTEKTTSTTKVAKSTKQSKVSGSTTSSSSKQPEAKSESQTVVRDTSKYQAIIDKYQAALSGIQGISDINSFVALKAEIVTGGVGYAYHDFDGNGVEELIFALMPGRYYREEVLLDLYTIDKNNTVVRLTSGELGMLGERMTLWLLTDGTLAYHTSGGHNISIDYLYHFNDQGDGLVKGEDITKPVEKFDLSGLSWKNALATNNEVSLPQASAFNLSAIMGGDYSSIAGTWKNGYGYTLTFTSDSLTLNATDSGSDNTSMSLSDFKFLNTLSPDADPSIVTALIRQSGYTGGAGSFYFVPAGSRIDMGNHRDASDTSKDRLFVLQHPGVYDPKVALYKVN